jgi:signal transduction histidine kinase
MALHTELPIYRTGVQLLTIAVKVQEQMPRGVKRSLGDKISQHCVEMLDLMALANATMRGERAGHIKALMTHLRATTVLLRVSHDSRYVSHRLWAESVALLDSIGKQGGGWLKSAANTAPAA